MVSMVLRQTILPLVTPDELRGRVNAVEMVFISASNELGAFESGVAAALVGAVPAVVIGGVATVAVAVLWLRRLPAPREGSTGSTSSGRSGNRHVLNGRLAWPIRAGTMETWRGVAIVAAFASLRWCAAFCMAALDRSTPRSI